MIAAAVVFVYLALVLYVGIFAFRRGTNKSEDFFLANRSLGTVVFLLSLFGSNMTSFAILGSSGLSFRIGIGVYGLMASISAIIIPLSILIIGTRIWAIGKRLGHVTQVQIFRDRWEMGHIGTVIFVLQALMLIPYIIIGVMGGGETLEGVSNGAVAYWFGGLIVALVVMSYVFFGGMRGTAWVNTLQTSMFLVFGTIAFYVIAHGMGGFGKTAREMVATLQPRPVAAVQAPATAPAMASAAKPPAAPPPRPDGELLTRARVSKGWYFSYMFIPLSSIMFPHIAIFCLTAKRMSSFRKTVIFYPLCIMAIWLPAVFLGAMASSRPEIISDTAGKSAEMAQWIKYAGGPDEDGNPTGANLAKLLLASKDAATTAILADIKEHKLTPDELGERLTPLYSKYPPIKGELRRLAGTNGDGIMLAMLTHFSPGFLAGILGAAIMACVMASDSQILALSTMWAEDVFAFYGGRKAYGEAAQVWSARIFVVAVTIVAYIIAIAVRKYESIFDLAIQYAFSGYASMTPIMLACLFWKRSTKWGALAATIWVAACLILNSWLQYHYAAPQRPTDPAIPISWSVVGGVPLLLREYTRISFTSEQFLLVMPMFVGSCILMVLGSLLTPPPSRQTIEKYFPTAAGAAQPLVG